MIKKLTYSILAILMISGCTGKNNSLIPDVSVQPDLIVELNNLTSDLSAVSSLNFGDVSNITRSSDKTLLIKNSTASTIVFNDVDSFLISGDGYVIVINRCSSSLAAGKSCEVRLSLRSRALYNDAVHNGSLSIKGADNQVVDIQLLGSISGQPNPNSSGSPVLTATLNKSFGVADSLIYRTLTITNSGTGTAFDLGIDSLASTYSIRLSRCPSSLAPGRSCEIQIIFNAFRQGLPTISVDIKVAAKDFHSDQVSVNVASIPGSSVPEAPGVVFKSSPYVRYSIYIDHSDSEGNGFPGYTLTIEPNSADFFYEEVPSDSYSYIVHSYENIGPDFELLSYHDSISGDSQGWGWMGGTKRTLSLNLQSMRPRKTVTINPPSNSISGTNFFLDVRVNNLANMPVSENQQPNVPLQFSLGEMSSPNSLTLIEGQIIQVAFTDNDQDDNGDPYSMVFNWLSNNTLSNTPVKHQTLAIPFANITDGDTLQNMAQ